MVLFDSATGVGCFGFGKLNNLKGEKYMFTSTRMLIQRGRYMFPSAGMLIVAAYL
ncbi:unnamed protein product [Coffea canephora]|uniref:Uncharacterized protein n=1 Tax=Coffea canephora TaxID=49390 RepID=A0A068VAX7_COFCA|nr:unnamed protein product [Coffea canephora]